MLKEMFAKRFKELLIQSSALKPIPNTGATDGWGSLRPGQWQQWATSTQSLIRASFGEKSPHYINFVNAFINCRGYENEFNVLQGIFLSAMEDFEGGYVFDVELRVSGEVFGDFIALARQSLSENHKDVAAVLACAALEDALKRFAAANQIEVDGKNMQDIVNSLKANGFVTGAQKSLLDVMPRIRNHAMHAQWEKISEPDVSSVLGFVEQFLLSKFSG